MDLTRRQFAYLVSALYCAGGALLLFDFVASPSAPGAHLPLAWHVLPVALAGNVVAHAAAVAGPLDADWPVSIRTVIAAYIPAALICGAAIIWLISPRPDSGAGVDGN